MWLKLSKRPRADRRRSRAPPGVNERKCPGSGSAVGGSEEISPPRSPDEVEPAEESLAATRVSWSDATRALSSQQRTPDWPMVKTSSPVPSKLSTTGPMLSSTSVAVMADSMTATLAQRERPRCCDLGLCSWSCGELNPRPLPCHGSALPTELQPRTSG